MKKRNKNKNWWTKVKKIRYEADKEWQVKCMAGGGLCEICEINPAYCCHHYIEKSLSNRLRYELFNGIRVCKKCHNAIHSTSDPAIFRKMDKVLGKKKINKLEKLRRDEVKVCEEWYQNNLERLKKICLKKKLSAPTPF